MMKTNRLGEGAHQHTPPRFHDGLPEGWRSAWLAGLPHGLLATLSLIFTLVSPLQPSDKAAENIGIFYLVVALTMGLVLVVLHPLARDLHALVEVAVLEVAGREDVPRVGGVDDGSRAEALHALAQHRVVLADAADLLGVLLEGVRVLHVELPRAPGAHRLEA